MTTTGSPVAASVAVVGLDVTHTLIESPRLGEIYAEVLTQRP